VVGDYNHVCFVRHALALDERRAPFKHLPISDSPLHTDESPLGSHEVHIKEVWFVGSHSEVCAPMYNFFRTLLLIEELQWWRQ
jgi:hypothetical protein